MTDTPRDWADDAAKEIADSHIYEGSDHNDRVSDVNGLQQAIAQALRDARRVPDGHVREG